MYPVAFHSAQRTIQVWGTAGIVVFGAMSFVVGSAILGGSSQSGQVGAWNVTYQNISASVTGASGNAPQRAVTDVDLDVKGANLTSVDITIMWTDNTVSPGTDPVVTATITGPSGTPSVTNRVAGGGGTTIFLFPMNEQPANQTVQASSADGALSQAAANSTNTTMGVGMWTVSLDVGSVLGGILRPGASITFSIDVEIRYFVGSAKPL